MSFQRSLIFPANSIYGKWKNKCIFYTNVRQSFQFFFGNRKKETCDNIVSKEFFFRDILINGNSLSVRFQYNRIIFRCNNM